MIKNYRDYFILSLIWLLGIVSDRLWFTLDHGVPAWDQADYLTASLNYWHFLQSPQWFSPSWWQGLWMLSPKIPPLTYLLSVPFLNLSGTGADQTTLVYLLFSGVLLYSVYGIGSQLFTPKTGLWAAAICIVLPGLYLYRLQFLLDFPLTAMVTFCFFCLTKWREATHQTWLWTIGLGFSLGLAVFVKQTAVFFLFIPFLWTGIQIIKHQNWQRLIQLLLATIISILIIFPWAKTNWLLMLTSGKRATLDSALAEGDPALNTLQAWTYYWNLLPQQISWILLIIPIVGILLFGLRSKNIKMTSWRWLGVFLIGGYFLCSLNINKDFRYSLPLLPVLSILLAHGLLFWPKNWGKIIRQLTISLAGIVLLLHLWPIGGDLGETIAKTFSPKGEYQATLHQSWPHEQVINTIIQTEPYLTSTLGVLPSTPEINQHNLNYFGALRDFQVYGRQVGTRLEHFFQDSVSLSWFITKTNQQGSVNRISKAQAAIVTEVEQGTQFKLKKQWDLPDKSTLNLYQRKLPYFEITPSSETHSNLQLKQVIISPTAPPGVPIPLTYIWSGSGQQLKSGLMLLTWKSQSDSSQWFHDHQIAMGSLHANSMTDEDQFQIVERMTMLPPKDAKPGIYTLTATYLNPQTGETNIIPIPAVTIEINPQATALPGPPLDLVTQLQQLAKKLPDGMAALESIFDEVARINQYDPTQDYTRQAEHSLTYRLQQEPNNLEIAYGLALANVLQQDAEGAITALQQVVKLDSNNPFAYAYLGFVYLYNWQPKRAENALQFAFKLDPNQPDFKLLLGVSQILQGKLILGYKMLI